VLDESGADDPVFCAFGLPPDEELLHAAAPIANASVAAPTFHGKARNIMWSSLLHR
jgi:hypothetical protein